MLRQGKPEEGVVGMCEAAAGGKAMGAAAEPQLAEKCEVAVGRCEAAVRR